MAAPGRKAALAASRATATAARIGALSLPSGEGAWMRTARAEALARVRDLGLPDRRDEYWRHTDPATLAAAEAASAGVGDRSAVFDGTGAVRLVFLDGRFDAAASDAPEAAGLEIERLADIAAHDIHWARDLYGRLEAAGQSPVPRSLAALNSATATDGVVIRATGAAERPVLIVYLRSPDAPASDGVLHHVLRVEPGAKLTLLEEGPGAARLSVVTEVEVGERGEFHHIRSQGRDPERRAHTHLFGRVAGGGVLKSFTMAANGALTRNEAVLAMTGPEAVVHIAGAALGDGAFLHDDTVFIHHAAPRCESRQVFKKVLRHGAVGVFQGKILVDAEAQLTDGYQISQSLLLDEDCQFLAKPELEIYADDVKCSHGSTSGEIDAEALFYLRARGVGREEATRLLVLAFVAEALDEIEDAALADCVRARLDDWLQRHKA